MERMVQAMDDKISSNQSEVSKHVLDPVSLDDDLPHDKMPEADTEQSPTSKRIRIRDIALPTGLNERVIKQYAMAVCVTIFTVILLFAYHTPQCLLGFGISGLLVYMGISTKLDYYDGKITELCLLCASVAENKFKRSTHLVFRTTDEIPSYYVFDMPGFHQKDFMPNTTYVVYFNNNCPSELLGYLQM
jgi:hypothetical protein